MRPADAVRDHGRPARRSDFALLTEWRCDHPSDRTVRQDPVPASAHARAGAVLLGALRARPVCVAPGVEPESRGGLAAALCRGPPTVPPAFQARAETRGWPGAARRAAAGAGDHDQALAGFFAGTHRRPRGGRRVGTSWVPHYPDCVAGDVRRLTQELGRGADTKVGRVRFRWSRRSAGREILRVTTGLAAGTSRSPRSLARSAPGNGEGDGVHRGVTVSAALSTGELLCCSGPDGATAAPHAAAGAQAGSRAARIGGPHTAQDRQRSAQACAADRRGLCCEKTST